MKDLPEELRPTCSCGGKMTVVTYIGYHDEFNYFMCTNDECELDANDYETYEGWSGTYAQLGGIMHDEKSEDLVNHPSHYNQGGIETLDVIKMSLTEEEYSGYLKGNVLKYRERAQFKGNAEQDYAKAKFYYDEVSK